MLAQGKGKGRIGRRRDLWSTFVISSGEITLEEQLCDLGLEVTPGLESRCIDVYKEIFVSLYGFEPCLLACNSLIES
jgi:hypothetical protein